MPFFNWALLKSRTLHPDIGIPIDDTQGLPYLNAFNISKAQNYGISIKAESQSDSITGYLFTVNTRYLLGSGEAIALDVTYDNGPSMFAIDNLSGHVFASTESGILNNPINISGNKLGWSGVQTGGAINCNPVITFFNYLGSDYVGFGNSDSYTFNFGLFTPGGVVYRYNNYLASECVQPCAFFNGLYNILTASSGYGSQYGPISLGDAPEILPAFTPSFVISYSFTESAILLSKNNNVVYGYDGFNDPTLTSSFIKLNFAFNNSDIFGFDPVARRLMSISDYSVKVDGLFYYPVYVYNDIMSTTPQQYARPVKNYTVNGHLNWRKR